MLRCFVHSCPYEGNLRNAAKKKKHLRSLTIIHYFQFLFMESPTRLRYDGGKNEVKSFHVFREEISKYAKVKPLQPIWKLRKGK